MNIETEKKLSEILQNNKKITYCYYNVFPTNVFQFYCSKYRNKGIHCYSDMQNELSEETEATCPVSIRHLLSNISHHLHIYIYMYSGLANQSLVISIEGNISILHA